MLSARLSSDVCHLVCALNPRFSKPVPGRAGFGTRLWPLVACQSPVRLLDCFIVATSVWDVLVDILTALLDENGFESVSGLSTLKAFRVVRVTRVLKIAQLLRIFRFVMALRNSGPVHLSHAESLGLGLASTASDRAPWPACKVQEAWQWLL